MKPPYYAPLTGVRAIAALMVYLHHYNPGKYIIHSMLAHNIVHEFHVGVTIFFTLSGFLVASRYLSEAQFSFAYISRYFANRFARIYPLYFILTVIALLRTAHELGGSWFYFYAVGMNLFLLKGFSLEYFSTGIPQAWSLTVEECFYAFAIIFFICLNSRKRRKTVTWLAAIVLIPVTGLFLVELCQWLQLPFFENTAFVVSYTFFGRFTELLFGVGLAVLMRRTQFKSRLPVLTYSGIILFAFGIYALMLIKDVYHVNYGTSHPFGVAVNNLYLPVGICVFFTGLLRERTIVSAVLASKIFSVLGRSSYALYLIHIGFIQVYLLSFFNIKTAPGAVAMLVSLLGIAMVLYYCIEEPANKIIRAFASRSRWLTPISSLSTSA